MPGPEYGATITPRPEGMGCEMMGCEETDLLALVEPDIREEARLLCPEHRVEYLREVYRQ